MSEPRKKVPSPEKVRQQVGQIMTDWQSYPDFAHLFEALMRANGATDLALASQYQNASANYISEQIVRSLRRGDRRPTYQFVSDIVDHALLSLDPERVSPASGDAPAGAHRIALFAAAGLIEVTPESIVQWDRDVLAGWQRRCHESSGGAKPTWQELMHKLLDFQMQGERMTFHDVAQLLHSQPGSNHPMNRNRIISVLSGNGVPTQEERLRLAEVAGLDAAQVNLIEAAVEDRSLSIQRRLSHSTFSVVLGELLERLRQGGISQRQLSLLATAPDEASGPQLNEATISSWKFGRASPTSPFNMSLLGLSP